MRLFGTLKFFYNLEKKTMESQVGFDNMLLKKIDKIYVYFSNLVVFFKCLNFWMEN